MRSSSVETEFASQWISFVMDKMTALTTQMRKYAQVSVMTFVKA